jgi:hypothetical protein
MRLLKPRFALILLVAFAVAFAVTGLVAYLLDHGGGGLAEPTSAGQRRWTIEDATNFTEFPLYWLGESYNGLPLTRIIRYRYDPEPPIPAVTAEDSVAFIYGTCTPSPEAGCAPPLQIIVEPYCTRPPEIIAPLANVGSSFDIRGATAQWVTDHLRIWTGDVSTTIFAAEEMTAAEQLRLVSEGPEGALLPLGPPTASC